MKHSIEFEKITSISATRNSLCLYCELAGPTMFKGEVLGRRKDISAGNTFLINGGIGYTDLDSNVRRVTIEEIQEKVENKDVRMDKHMLDGEEVEYVEIANWTTH